MTRRRYLFQVGTAFGLAMALLAGWWIYWPDLQDMMRDLPTSSAQWFLFVGQLTPALISVAVVLQAVEAWVILGQFAAKERIHTPHSKIKLMDTYKSILFDLDGTLIDSFAAITASVNHVRERRGLPPLTEAEVSRHVGRGAIRLMEEAVPVGSVEENLAWYSAHHSTVLRPLTRLLPGAAEAVRVLHTMGKKTGICSNKPVAFTRELMDYLGLAEHLTLLLGPEDVPRPKPAPDMLQEAMHRLGVSPEQTLYIGDMTIDIETGKAAGVTVWAVATGTQSATELHEADRVLSSLIELLGTETPEV
jgi:phosphoglycolate phosphatase